MLKVMALEHDEVHRLLEGMPPLEIEGILARARTRRDTTKQNYLRHIAEHGCGKV